MVDEDRQAKNDIPLYQYINGRTIHTYYAQFLGRGVIPHSQAQWNENYIRCGYKIQPDTNMLRFYEDSDIDETEWILTLNSNIYDFQEGDSIKGFEAIDNFKIDKEASFSFQGFVKRISEVGVKISNNSLVQCKRTLQSYDLKCLNVGQKIRGNFQVYSMKGVLLGNSSNLNNLSNGIYILRRYE
jgi:hypothetical protein